MWPRTYAWRTPFDRRLAFVERRNRHRGGSCCSLLPRWSRDAAGVSHQPTHEMDTRLTRREPHDRALVVRGARSGAFDRVATADLSVAAVLIAGAVLRLWQWLANPSLGVDEAALARNIVGRPLFQLFTPLDFGQVAPPGFLFAERVAVWLLGDGEHVLRLIPLACGLAALPLFDRVARKFVEGPAHLLAVALFALGVPFIYYASQVKQYSGDVAAALIVLLLAAELRPGHTPRVPVVWIGAVGAMLPWISQGAVFVLAGMVAVVGVHGVRGRSLVWQVYACLLLWIVSAAAAVVVASRAMRIEDALFMQRYLAGGFLPVPPWHGDALRWMWTTLAGVFGSFSNAPPTLDAGMHLPRPWIFAALAVTGGVALAIRRRERAELLLAPLVLLVVAAAAQRYPFAGRVALFAVPLFLILAAAGAEVVVGLLRRAVGPFAMGLYAILAVFPLRAVATNLPPDWQEHLRPILEYVARNRHPGDIVHVYYGAGQGFLYYAARQGFRPGEYEIGRCAMDEPRSYLEEVDRLRGRSRVWMIFSHSLQGAREIRLIVAYLNAVGRRLDAVPAIRSNAPLSASAYAFLYDLSG